VRAGSAQKLRAGDRQIGGFKVKKGCQLTGSVQDDDTADDGRACMVFEWHPIPALTIPLNDIPSST
jgi:hypothetical protein